MVPASQRSPSHTPAPSPASHLPPTPDATALTLPWSLHPASQRQLWQCGGWVGGETGLWPPLPGPALPSSLPASGAGRGPQQRGQCGPSRLGGCRPGAQLSLRLGRPSPAPRGFQALTVTLWATCGTEEHPRPRGRERVRRGPRRAQLPAPPPHTCLQRWRCEGGLARAHVTTAGQVTGGGGSTLGPQPTCSLCSVPHPLWSRAVLGTPGERPQVTGPPPQEAPPRGLGAQRLSFRATACSSGPHLLPLGNGPQDRHSCPLWGVTETRRLRPKGTHDPTLNAHPFFTCANPTGEDTPGTQRAGPPPVLPPATGRRL